MSVPITSRSVQRHDQDRTGHSDLKRYLIGLLTIPSLNPNRPSGHIQSGGFHMSRRLMCLFREGRYRLNGNSDGSETDVQLQSMVAQHVTFSKSSVRLQQHKRAYQLSCKDPVIAPYASYSPPTHQFSHLEKRKLTGWICRPGR